MVHFVLNPRKVVLTVFVVCIVSQIGMLVLDYHISYGRLIDIGPIRNMFNMAREDSLASWFAVTQTILTALTVWLIYSVLRAQSRPQLTILGWLVIALFFTYMGLDDGIELHERLGAAYKTIYSHGDARTNRLPFFPSYPWQVIFMPVFIGVGLFMFLFFWRQASAPLCRALLIGGLGCFALAVGLDFIEGLDKDHPWNFYLRFSELRGVDVFTTARFNRDGFEATRHFGKSIEEAVEMFGMTLLWIFFLLHAMSMAGSMHIDFKREKSIDLSL